MLTITNDFSRKVWIILTAKKSDFPQVFQAWRRNAEKECGEELHRVRTDNAREFISGLKQHEQEGVTPELIIPYQKEQNGVAERMNRTILEKARALLDHSGLPDEFWREAVKTAEYLRNRLPIKGRDKPPQELWTGKPVSYDQLKVFGCLTYVHIPKEKQDGKLARRA